MTVPDEGRRRIIPESYQAFLDNGDVYTIYQPAARRNAVLTGLRALVTQFPEVSAEVLRELGYIVTPPSE